MIDILCATHVLETNSRNSFDAGKMADKAVRGVKSFLKEVQTISPSAGECSQSMSSSSVCTGKVGSTKR